MHLNSGGRGESRLVRGAMKRRFRRAGDISDTVAYHVAFDHFILSPIQRFYFCRNLYSEDLYKIHR